MEGMYPVFMADWLRIFPRQQMHIIRYEDYAKDLEGEITKVFKFLDLGIDVCIKALAFITNYFSCDYSTLAQ